MSRDRPLWFVVKNTEYAAQSVCALCTQVIIPSPTLYKDTGLASYCLIRPPLRYLSNMLAWTVVQLVVLLWVIHFIWRKFFAGRSSSLPEPPGPYGLPVLGYMPFLGKRPHLTLTKLKEKYGDIFQLQIGAQKTVVLSSVDIIREAYSKVHLQNMVVALIKII